MDGHVNEPSKLRRPIEESNGLDRWVAWNREQTQVVASGATRAEAIMAAHEAGEGNPVLEDRTRTTRLLAEARQGAAEAAEEMLRAEGGSLSLGEASTLLRTSRHEVEERRRTGTVFAVVWQGEQRYPAWQFAAGRPIPGLELVLADLRVHNPDPWAFVRFFLSANPRLGGATPLQELRCGSLEVVRRAARTYGEHGAA
jgi:hypothetical protein